MDPWCYSFSDREFIDNRLPGLKLAPNSGCGCRKTGFERSGGPVFGVGGSGCKSGSGVFGSGGHWD